jgi:hypothetical protein
MTLRPLFLLAGLSLAACGQTSDPASVDQADITASTAASAVQGAPAIVFGDCHSPGTPVPPESVRWATSLLSVDLTQSGTLVGVAGSVECDLNSLGKRTLSFTPGATPEAFVEALNQVEGLRAQLLSVFVPSAQLAPLGPGYAEILVTSAVDGERSAPVRVPDEEAGIAALKKRAGDALDNDQDDDPELSLLRAFVKEGKSSLGFDEAAKLVDDLAGSSDRRLSPHLVIGDRIAVTDATGTYSGIVIEGGSTFGPLTDEVKVLFVDAKNTLVVKKVDPKATLALTAGVAKN